METTPPLDGMVHAGSCPFCGRDVGQPHGSMCGLSREQLGISQSTPAAMAHDPQTNHRWPASIIAQLRAIDEPHSVKSIATKAADGIERLDAALRSIAANTCCDSCREAALVAKEALGEQS